MLRVSGLSVFPVKSCGGVSVSSAKIVLRGIEHDHRWMVVDENGVMLTQRDAPALATVATEIGSSVVRLRADEMSLLSFPLRPRDTGARRTVFIHGKPVEAMDMDDTTRVWFSSFLGRPARLVWFPETSHRFTNRDPRVECAFQDGYPLLVLSDASLDELNRRLVERGKSPLPMNRFRPNMTVDGCDPNQEDRWTGFEAGNATFRGVKLCARCRITQTDQALGAVTSGEPIRTLATYRERVDGDEKIHLFGLNANHTPGGIVRVGDRVTVTATGEISH